jgi:hypothetical protein
MGRWVARVSTHSKLGLGSRVPWVGPLPPRALDSLFIPILPLLSITLYTSKEEEYPQYPQTAQPGIELHPPRDPRCAHLPTPGLAWTWWYANDVNDDLFERLCAVRRAEGRVKRFMSSEDALARAAALAHVDAHVPMALEPVPQAAPVVPVSGAGPEKREMASEPQAAISPPEPGTPGIRELTAGEMFALDLNATALAEERQDYCTDCPGCSAPLAYGVAVCADCYPDGCGKDSCSSHPGDIQPQPAPKRRRRTAEEVTADKVAKLAEREAAKAARAAEREALKLERARERVQAKEDARLAKIAEAEGGRVELPAIVIRTDAGQPPAVRHVSDTDAWAVLSSYLGHLFIDAETSGYPLGHQLYELRTVQLGGEEAAVVFDASDPEQLQVVSLALAMAEKLTAHSAVADIVPCVQAGLISWDGAWAKMHDSVLYLKLTDPKLSGSDASKLKEVAGDLLGDYAVSPPAEKAKNALFKAMGCLTDTELSSPAEKNGWTCVSRNSVVMTAYAGSDVLDLAAVMRVLPPLPVADSVLERERLFQKSCARISLDGFKLDSSHIKAKIAEYEGKQAEAERNTLVLSDGRITNPKSPEVASALIAQFPGIELGASKTTGNPSAAKKELEQVKMKAREGNPLLYHLASQILEARHCSTTLNLLLRAFEARCDYGDSRMRPTIYTINASTGRTSAVRENIQQLSRQGGVRACVVADEGYVGVDADFQGCEICVAAGLSGDRGLLEAETSPKCYACTRNPCECGKGHTGLHWMAAHEAFGRDATKEHRYWCKRGIFAKLFGGGVETGADQVYCDVRDMQKVFDAFSAIAPVYTAWDKWLRQCYYDGKLVWRDYEKGENFSQDIEGKRHMVYRAYSGRQIYIENGAHAAGNGAIQGTARELLVDGVLNWAAGPWGHLPLAPVHDEVFGWVPAQDGEAALAYLVKCMETSVLSSPGFEVRIGADPSPLFTAWPDSS